MVGHSSPDDPRYPVRPLAFVAPRLITLRDKCRALVRGNLRAHFWPLVTVVACDTPPDWGAALLRRCGEGCKGTADCPGYHETLFAVSARTSVVCYRRFARKARALFGSAEKARPRRKFVRGPEDRA